ncbi:C-type lectin domain-containing protein [Anabas testudineus]|uniref:C-type lectin domain-containing protein n=1 Tax=Anabas testudineus TaxID=64144 RepID=A0A7N6FJY3_ANATE|nr:C-type lectin domain-containing protein [Anabas testudineus]
MLCVTDRMKLIHTKGTQGIRGHTILFVVIGLLITETSTQAANSTDEELLNLKLRLNTWKNRYRVLCNKYSELAANSSAPVINCTGCPDGWFQVGDQCFLLTRDVRVDWQASKKKCAEIGSHLAILTSKEQHEALENERMRTRVAYTDFWIGLTDVENEGDWKWVDNSMLKTPFWNTLKSEPDNNQSGGEEGEDCAVVDSKSQSWYDVPCSFLYHRVCQMDAIPLQ